MVQVFSQYLNILWKEFPASLWKIKEAGYDGVECHLIGNLLGEEKIAQVEAEAKALRLELRFHQGWSWRTGQDIWQNWVLRFAGALVPSNLSFEQQTRHVNKYPVVMYGNVARTTLQKNYLFQSIVERRSRSEKGYALTITEFWEVVSKHNLPVVFDVQHILEWYFDVENVAKLPNDPKRLNESLCRLWDGFKPYVREIHLCDFDPARGPSNGRNLYIGTGILPIIEFAEEVRRSKWSGIVTPEVQPQYLRGNNLRAVSELARKLFD